MRDRALSEQNRQWLLSLHKELAKVQQLVVEMATDCEPEAPYVDWVALGINLQRPVGTIKHAQTTLRTWPSKEKRGSKASEG